jgi:cytochrome c
MRSRVVRVARAARVAVAAFVALGAIAALGGCEWGRHEQPHRQVPGGSARDGRTAILRHGCGGCHVIPGIQRAEGRVAPPLNAFAERGYVAGVVANNPDNLIRWLRNPSAVNPGTAMPALGLTEAEARDIAAYLYTLR